MLTAAVVVALTASAAQAESHDVHIVANSPQPQQINVANGDTVFFVNDDNVAHAIFANGQQFGGTIMPHQTGGPYGPFTGDGAEYAYHVDSNTGPCGVIVVGAGSSSACAGAPPPTTKPTSTTVVTTTTAVAPATTTTAVTTTSTASTTTTTTTTPSTTTSSETAAGESHSSSDDDGSTSGVRIAGLALMMVGVIGLVVALASQRRHAAPTAPPPEEPVEDEPEPVG